MSKNLILQTKNLKKTFITKKQKSKIIVEAVKGVNLEVFKGEIFGFLGPNGAGKTTTLNMLTTLTQPTEGDAKVVGLDLLKDAKQIRHHIGYVSQAGGSDVSANAFENLVMQARLFGVSKVEAANRADELIERFQMKEFALRLASSYSGGQKRRLDLALGIIHNPDIVFLDEPTTGLDPQSRAYFWDEIKKINKEGMTIFLTTHYLEEADQLCDRLSIIDHGEIVATGTNDALKKEIGRESIIIGMESITDIQKAKDLLGKFAYVNDQYVDNLSLVLYLEEAEKHLFEILQILDKENFTLQTIALAKPSLDDVFLQKTGRSLREGKEK